MVEMKHKSTQNVPEHRVKGKAIKGSASAIDKDN